MYWEKDQAKPENQNTCEYLWTNSSSCRPWCPIKTSILTLWKTLHYWLFHHYTNYNKPNWTGNPTTRNTTKRDKGAIITKKKGQPSPSTALPKPRQKPTRNHHHLGRITGCKPARVSYNHRKKLQAPHPTTTNLIVSYLENTLLGLIFNRKDHPRQPGLQLKQREQFTSAARDRPAWFWKVLQPLRAPPTNQQLSEDSWSNSHLR